MFLLNKEQFFYTPNEPEVQVGQLPLWQLTHQKVNGASNYKQYLRGLQMLKLGQLLHIYTILYNLS